MTITLHIGGLAALATAVLPLLGGRQTGVLTTDQSAEAEPAFGSTRMVLPRKGTTLALRDLTGDGRLELLQVDASGVQVRCLNGTGQYVKTGALLPWPGASVGWDIADLDGDGESEFLMATRATSAVRHRFSAKSGWSSAFRLVNAPVYVPASISRMPFARDIDADGRVDLALPGRGEFMLWRSLGGKADAGVNQELRPCFEDPITVRVDPEIDHDFGDPRRLSGAFAQRIRIPQFTVRDVDGDGREDLIATSDDIIGVHLATPDIGERPTWTLDLTALKAEVHASDIDLENLLGFVSGFAQWRIADLDGKAPNDLIVGADGTFKVYLGGTATGTGATPDQVLKASGNILRFYIRDVTGDGRMDLQLVRGDRISMNRLLRFLLVPGRLNFDIVTYAGDGSTFARRPTKRATLGLRVPRLLSFIAGFDEVGKKIEAQWDIPARRIAWDADGVANDVVDETGGRLRVYRDCAPAQQSFEGLTMAAGIEGLVEAALLKDMDGLADEGVSEIDIGALDEFVLAPGKVLRDATQAVKPSVDLELAGPLEDRVIHALDLDGDGRLDLVTSAEGQRSPAAGAPGEASTGVQDTYVVELFVRR